MLLIRPAISNDAILLKTLIHEFADFEHLQASITEEALLRDGFGPHPTFHALLAEWDAQPAGYAIFFDYYSCFRCRGLFLEDIYVRSQFRGHGIGRALFAQVALTARQEDCFGIMFNVLDWNRPAIDFYKKLNASFYDDWKVVCLERLALDALACETR
jgi:GNAT superfamily N-acetyltransferase